MEQQECRVSFRILGEELNPDLVSEELGIKAHRADKKGEHPHGNERYRPYPHGRWSIDSQLPILESLDEHLGNLLDQLQHKEFEIVQYAENNDVGFVCSILGGGNININHAILERIARIGADLILHVSP